MYMVEYKRLFNVEILHGVSMVGLINISVATDMRNMGRVKLLHVFRNLVSCKNCYHVCC